MKKHLETIFGTLRSVLLATVTAAIIFGPTSALAADNQATWNVAGAAQTPSNIVSISSVDVSGLSLVKAAFLTSDNSAISSPATLPIGTSIDFVIYIDNDTGFAVSDVNINDQLNALFAYQLPPASTIKVYNLTGTGATAQAIYDDVRNLGTAQTNATGDDFASYDAPTTTISAGRIAGNTQVDLTVGTVWAMMFTVVLQ
ncbi:MAG: hypothetical protein C0623_14310 [Desulfuromonas sp.]|nr:MAG: hypothetical protein C0623_14310 [Desulfuromonas sp.]